MRRSEIKAMHTKIYQAAGAGSPSRAGLVPTAVLLVNATLFCLSACTVVGPDYTPPVVESPSQWHTPLEDGLTGEAAAPETLADWWTVLHDPLLNSLQERAITGNLDLKEALARIREARALRGGSEAALWPAADGQLSMTRGRSSANSGGGTESESYAAGFDADWELDIFGGKHRAVESAQADLEAVAADLRDVQISLMAEVALNYVEARTNQARLAAAEANLATQEHTYELNRSRYQAGLIDELDVKQSLYNLESTRSQVPLLQAGLASARNRLAVLLGQHPGTLDKELAASAPVPVPPASMAVGIPADTLRRRPDIRQAERNLAARTADIGVATSDLYPKFRLMGGIGLEALSLDELPEWASRTWSIGPSISWKIFDAGAIRQNIAVRNARQEQAMIQYEATVLAALEEVENALMNYAREQERRDALERATEAARQAEMLARDRYKNGLVNFNSVLEAQRSLLSFQDELARSQGAVTAGLISLYKALGGGWRPLSEVDNGSEEVED